MTVTIKAGTEVDTFYKKDVGMALASSELVELSGRTRFFKLRDTWSRWIIGWITVLIAFNILITLAVGLGCLDFEKYQWFITLVTVETFLQVIALGAIAVKYLFSDVKPSN